MATVLHLLGHNDPGRALPVIAEQLAAGDVVTVAVIGSAEPSLLPGLTVHRVPGERSWDQLLDLIFTTDETYSW